MPFTHYPQGVTSFGIPIYGGGIGPVIGVGTGDVKYVVTAKTSSNLYYEKLRTNGIADGSIFISPSTAFADCTAAQNDVVVVFPGAYALTAELAWNKANTHMVGVGGPNSLGDYSEPNVCIYTATAAIGSTINITGQNCSFYNLNVENSGAHATNICAVKVNKYGCYFNHCRIAGNMVSAQNASANTCSLWIAEAGMYPMFDDCQIGQDVWGNRTTANGGVIKYETSSGASSGRPNGSDFNRCRIVSIGDDANCVMVRVTAATAVGRGHRFQDCYFQHWDGSGAGSTTLASAFYTPSTAVHKHIFHLLGCGSIGIDEWQTDDDSVVMASMPITGVGGGLGRNPTGTAGQ